MNPLIVYTAIVGGFQDKLRPPVVSDDNNGRRVRFVCFSDVITTPVEPWELRPLVWEHEISRRSARYHKLLSTRLFPEHQYSLWLDGSEQLKVNPWSMVDKYLTAADFAVFKHPQRRFVADEVKACDALKKDDRRLMDSQLMAYKSAGFRDSVGLFETTLVLRRHTPFVASINELWWSELRRWSVRDQISLPYVVWKLGARVGLLEGCRIRNPFTTHYPHR